jgi:hypothetical protein
MSLFPSRLSDILSVCLEIPIEDSHGEGLILSDVVNTPTPLLIGNCSQTQTWPGYSPETAITVLELVQFNLSGTLPVDSLIQLPYLMLLNLQGNRRLELPYQGLYWYFPSHFSRLI